jgi:uridine kinase
VIADGEPASIEELTALIVSRADGGPWPMIIAVDGHSSSGKTTLAGRLATALPAAAVLHTDDLAWHQGVFAWDELLLTDVLPVVRSGSPLDYRPPQWVARSRPGSITLPGNLEFLLIEGVGASQPSLRSAYAMIIWVETDEPTRLARDQTRLTAGEMTPDDYASWMAEENAYTVSHRPWEHADLLISAPTLLSESNAASDPRAELRILPAHSVKNRRAV